MSCLLFFNFVLLLFAITLLILGVTTSRWLVVPGNNPNHINTEVSEGIVSSCQRLYHDGMTKQYATGSNTTNIENDIYLYNDAYTCSNRLLKWHNSSLPGPEIKGKSYLIGAIEKSEI